MGVVAKFFSMFRSCREEALAGADFSMWVTLREAWKRRLESLLRGDDSERLDPERIRRDDACDLGRWICRERGSFEGHETFGRLEREHAAFHKCAGGIARKERGSPREKARSRRRGNESPCDRMLARSFHFLKGSS